MVRYMVGRGAADETTEAAAASISGITFSSFLAAVPLGCEVCLSGPSTISLSNQRLIGVNTT